MFCTRVNLLNVCPRPLVVFEPLDATVITDEVSAVETISEQELYGETYRRDAGHISVRASFHQLRPCPAEV